MTTSPPLLDIQAYHVAEFVFRALSEYDHERPTSSAIGVNFTIDQHEEDPLEFRIEMRLQVAETGYSADINAPYSISLTIVGYFTFAEGTENDVMQRMIHLNGLSILYGIARGFVGQATGAGRYAQYVLPTVNFISLLQERLAKLQAQIEAYATTQPPAEIQASSGQ